MEHLLSEAIPKTRVVNVDLGDTGLAQQMSLFENYVLPMFGGQPEMLENGLDRGRLGDKGNQRPVVCAPRTQERKTVIDVRHQRRP